jgi:hypothetical protein
MRWLERLPGSFGLTALALFLAQSLLAHVAAWLTGWLPAFTFSPLGLIFALWLWGPLAIMWHLNGVAREALASFSRLLDLDAAQLTRLEYEFTTMPSRPVLVSGLFWAAFYVLLTVLVWDTIYAGYGITGWGAAIAVLQGLISFLVGSAIYYHSLRQLRLVNRTVKLVTRLDLFQLDPVYAFSRLTARTGVSWMLLLSLTLLMYPLRLANGPVLALLIVQLLLAVAAFVLPLRFVNQRLVGEKRRLLAEHGRRVEATLAGLHRTLDADAPGDTGPFNDALAALEAELTVLTRIPTWPWRGGTLTAFLSAIALPIILFLLQAAIERWLSG